MPKQKLTHDTSIDRSNSTTGYADFCAEFFGVARPEAYQAEHLAHSRPATTTHGSAEESHDTAETELNALSEHLNARFGTAAKAFLKMDTDRSGKVSIDEIKAMESEYNIPSAHVDEMLAQLDKDHDGFLEYNDVAQA
jgi:hypothetical protein